MDELKAQLMEKLGLDESTSTQAIETVLGFVKGKLPENVAGMLDSTMSGEDIGGGLMEPPRVNWAACTQTDFPTIPA